MLICRKNNSDDTVWIFSTPVNDGNKGHHAVVFFTWGSLIFVRLLPNETVLTVLLFGLWLIQFGLNCGCCLVHLVVDLCD